MGTLTARGETALEPLSQRITGKMASRAASLTGFFAIFCDVSRNMYIF